MPARINVVGAITDYRFPTSNYPIINSDPSPDPVFVLSVQSNGDTKTGMFYDQTDRLLPGYASLAYAGADGVAEFDLEPGSYQVVVSRGDEYSVHKELITTVAGSTTNVNAQIARVLDTAGFISSDYHVHQVNSPDSRVALGTRAISFAAEGVENLVATDHDAITDMTPTIAARGLSAIPAARRSARRSRPSTTGTSTPTRRARIPRACRTARPTGAERRRPGLDFPAYGNHPLTPAQIEAAVLAKPQNAGLETVVQINHIGSHFNPLRIDTGVEPPQSFLPDPSVYRLNPAVTNFFHPFKALELWNGNNNSHQNQFTNERIGIWMNLLNQGIVSTAIADTDTHTIRNLDSAGARTWTPSSTDAPASIVDAEIGQAVKSHRAVGGQGIYVQTRLVEGRRRRGLQSGREHARHCHRRLAGSRDPGAGADLGAVRPHRDLPQRADDEHRLGRRNADQLHLAADAGAVARRCRVHPDDRERASLGSRCGALRDESRRCRSRASRRTSGWSWWSREPPETRCRCSRSTAATWISAPPPSPPTGRSCS